MRYLLDTNVISEPMHPRSNTTVLDWVHQQTPLDLCISTLTLGEIQKGVRLLHLGRRRTKIEEWLAKELPRRFAGRILSVDASVALAWGRLSAEARVAGRPLPAVDGLLLATASVHELTLVTRNERDCAERGIPLFNPWT